MKVIITFLFSAIVLSFTSSCDAAQEKKILKTPIIQKRINRSSKSKFSKRDSTSVSLYNAASREYLIEVGFGTPPQHFNVAFDIGSSDIWIPTQSCSTSMCPFTRFNNKKSSTFKALTDQVNIIYGIGSAKGTYGLDTITIGSVSLMNHTIGFVSDTVDILAQPSQPSITPSNGILGLSFPDLSMKSGEKPQHIISRLYENKVIDQAVFSIFLNKPFVSGNAGELTIGGVDSSRYSGKIQYAPVVSYDYSQYFITANLGVNQSSTITGSKPTYLYWAVPGQGVTASGGYSHKPKELQSFIFDTATTVTYVPPKVAEGIMSSILNNKTALPFDEDNGVYTVDCQLGKQNKSVVFLISNSTTSASASPIKLTVPLSDLVLPLDDALTPETSSLCMFGIAPSPEGLDLTSGDVYILGETVMRAFYGVFDLKNRRVGIAKLSNGTSTVKTSASSTVKGAPTEDVVSDGTPTEPQTSSAQLFSPSNLVVFAAALFTFYMY